MENGKTNKKKGKIFFVLFGIIFLFLINFVSALTIDSCQVLSSDNTFYQLNQSVNSTFTCIEINANNVTFDGGNFKIVYGNNGTPNGYGIVVNGKNYATIQNVNINESSVFGNNRYAIYLNNSNSSRINNVNITTNALVGYGIFIESSPFSFVSSVNVSTGGTNSHGIYFKNSPNFTLFSSAVSTTGSTSNAVYLQNASSGNLTLNSMIATTLNSIGIYVSSSSASNKLISNNVLTRGANGYVVYVIASIGEIINNNVLTGTGTNPIGIYLSTSANSNSVSSNIINVSIGHKIVLDGNSINNNFTNNSIIGRNNSYYDLNVANGCNGLWLIDQVNLFANYTFVVGASGSRINIIDSSYGQILFNSFVNGTGKNLSEDIRFADDFVFINSSSNLGFNRSSNITLYNIGNRGFSVPLIFRDNLPCPSSICSNFTSLTATNVSFNVSSWSSYSIMDNSSSVNISFISQNPADINSLNIFGIPLNINYSINSSSLLNQSSIIMYYKTNKTNSETIYFTNGTATSGFQPISFISNFSQYYLFRLFDSQVYPATYNINETVMENTVHSLQTLTTASDYASVELLNVSNSTQYSFFEIMANRTTGIQALRYYYCNSSYVFGVSNAPDINSNCVQYFSDTDGNYNHTHTQYSSHKIASFPINTTIGTILGIKITPVSYFMIRGATNWQYYYISNLSRTNATRTTSNNGVSWISQNYTIDAHLHQFSGNDTLWYYVCANDFSGNPVCSSLRNDLLNLAGLLPSSPNVYNPITAFYHDGLVINYTQSVSPNAYAVNFYNITLLNLNLTYNQTIIANNSNNLSYIYNSSLASDGFYIIKVTACDVLNQCSNGYSSYFEIDNTAPYGDLIDPTNNSFLNNPTVNFSINAVDNGSLGNLTLNIRYPNGTLIYQETIFTNATSGIFGIVYTFLTNGIFEWFYTIYDQAGNFFQTVIRTLNIVAVPSVLISYPVNSTSYNYTVTHLDYSVLNGDSCWYSLNGGITNVSVDCNVNSLTGLISGDGMNVWNVYANNSIGNESYDSVTFNSTCSNPVPVLQLDSYPYVDLNSSFDIKVSSFPFGFSNIKIKLTDPNNITNIYNMTYDNVSSYLINFIFTQEGNYNFIIFGDGVCPTVITNITGTFAVRKPFDITICGFSDKTGTAYKNEFAYLTAELISPKFNADLDQFITPLGFATTFKTNVFHTTYDNGCGTLKLYEPNATYVFRLIDGEITFPTSYSVPNMTKSYGTNIQVGQFRANGTSENLSVYLSAKDIRPYFWLMNYIFIFLIIAVVIISAFLFFVLSDKPSFVLIFFLIGIIGLIILRIIVFFWIG